MSFQKETSATGVIRIVDTKNSKLKFKEIIYIGLLLKSNKSTIEIEDWSSEIKKHDPIETNFEHFCMTKREWFSEAKVFVIPTQAFGRTKIEIFLNEHAIIGTGYTVEVYHRNGKTKQSFKNTDEITTSLGGLITTNIEWQILNKGGSTPITLNVNE